MRSFLGVHCDFFMHLFACFILYPPRHSLLIFRFPRVIELGKGGEWGAMGQNNLWPC
jgi:hypothetical protein